MSSLTAIFGSSEGKSSDSEKLLNLYWNRAELKKEFAGLRKEQFKLQDRIKQQEGSNARLQQKLDHLEELLIDPHWSNSVLVFYQLRGLATRCERKLARFAEQLKQQREQRQHNDVLDSWNEHRAQEVHATEKRLLEQKECVHQLENQLQAERHRLMSMSGLLKVFRRRSVTAVLDSLAEQIDRARLEEDALAATLKEIKDRMPPDSSGLDIQTKRSINLMILSFAQQLFLYFADDDLAKLAKEASDKSVGAVNYGDERECAELLSRIKRRLKRMEQATDFAGILQQRVKLISEIATFRSEDDAVPIADGVTTVFDIDQDGTIRKSDVDILGENYWGIGRILSR